VHQSKGPGIRKIHGRGIGQPEGELATCRRVHCAVGDGCRLFIEKRGRNRGKAHHNPLPKGRGSGGQEKGCLGTVTQCNEGALALRKAGAIKVSEASLTDSNGTAGGHLQRAHLFGLFHRETAPISPEPPCESK
jgi:hypothetical protein